MLNGEMQNASAAGFLFTSSFIVHHSSLTFRLTLVILTPGQVSLRPLPRGATYDRVGTNHEPDSCSQSDSRRGHGNHQVSRLAQRFRFESLGGVLHRSP